MRRILLALLLVTLLTMLSACDALSATTVRHGLRYGSARVEAPEAARVPLLLDLYTPTKRVRRPRPVVIVIHGGGFLAKTREAPESVRIADALASSGIVAASIDYRLTGRRPVLSNRVAPLLGGLPEGDRSRAVVAAVEDTLKAIRFLRRRADRLRIDPARIGLVGTSAGAITADHVAYVLDDYGIRRPKIRFVGSLWGGILIGSRGGGNPAEQLERGEAALFAAHGDRDPTLSVALSDQLVERARAQRVPHEYHRIAGGGHGPPRFFTEPVAGDDTAFDRLLAFARTHLRRRR
jgi:acetyl esterase/lipase